MKKLLLAIAVILALSAPVYAAEAPLVSDYAGVLTANEAERLNAAANELTARYKCEVRVYTVPDFSGGDVYNFSRAVFESGGFGLGEGKDGVMLLLSAKGRDYALIVHGFGVKAFTKYGQDKLLDEYVLPRLAENKYADAFDVYLAKAGEYLYMARNGRPFGKYTDPENGLSNIFTHIFLSLLFGSLAAAVPCLIWLRQMKTAVSARGAARYVTQEGLQLKFSQDIFVRRVETRVKIPSAAGGGSHSHHRGGGYSGRSGKF